MEPGRHDQIEKLKLKLGKALQAVQELDDEAAALHDSVSEEVVEAEQEEEVVKSERLTKLFDQARELCSNVERAKNHLVRAADAMGGL